MTLNKESICKKVGCDGQLFFLDNIPFYVVKESDWHKVTGGKKQPTQSWACGKDSFAMSQESYFKTNKYFWLEHEKGHCIYYSLHPELSNEYLPYPDNEVERFAFKIQFNAMKNAGLGKDDAFNLIKEAYVESDDWGKISSLEGFLKEMIKQVYENQN